MSMGMFNIGATAIAVMAKKAAEEGKVVKFNYTNGQGENSDRVVVPEDLIDGKSGYPVIVGVDQEKNSYRRFSVEHITDFKVVE